MSTLAEHPPGPPSSDAAAGEWSRLIRRQVGLCLRDPAAWQACAARSDQLEAAGIEPLAAVRQALEEHGG